MIIFFIFGLVALFFSRTFERGNIGLKLSMFTIFLFLGLRYDYGNDYMGYFEMFNDINENFNDYITDPGRLEIGWILLNRLFSHFGFHTLILFLSVVNSIILYKFIVKFVEQKYYWLAIFLYMFDSNFMLVQLSAMRQTVAILMFILAISYLIDKKYLNSLLILVFSVFFHTSSLLLLPIVFILYITSIKMNMFYIVAIELLFVYIFIFGESLEPHFRTIATLFFDEQYGIYLNDDIETKANFINIFTYSALVFLMLFYYNLYTLENKFFVRLLVLGMFFLPLGFILPISGRLALYLLPMSIVVYPNLLSTIDSFFMKKVFLYTIVLVTFVRLITFFNSETYGSFYNSYSTIFSLLKL